MPERVSVARRRVTKASAAAGSRAVDRAGACAVGSFDRGREQAFAAEPVAHLSRGFRVDHSVARLAARIDRLVTERRHRRETLKPRG